MHILFLSWWWPYPANNGAKLRIYNLLRHLSKSHKVTLLSFAETDEATSEQIEHLRQFCAHVEAVPKPVYNPTTTKALIGYLSRWPRSLVDVYSPVMAKRVPEVAHHCGINVIVASQLQTMRYLDLLPEIPAVLEEIEVTIFHDQVTRANRASGRFRAGLTLTKLENTLAGLLARDVAFTVVSESEREYIRHFAPAGSRIEVVPNGVDTSANRPDPGVTPAPHTLIYTGAVTYNANLDAADYFIREVWPLIRQRTPDAQFTVTGGTGRVDVSQLAAQPGVNFSGYLPSVAQAVQASWATVAPLRIGGGTRLKILESMALGTPVISTTKGAEGLNVTHGENILIADTPAALADAVHTLFSDSHLRARLAAGGRALVEREYDWSIITARLTALIEQVAQNRQIS